MSVPVTHPRSVNQRAALAVVWVTRVDDDSPASDARQLLELLGLVTEGGHELLPDDTQVITREGLEIELGGSGPRPPLVIAEPPDPRAHVPAGLRDLPPPTVPRKDTPMSAPAPRPGPPRPRLDVLEDHLVDAGVVQRDTPATPGRPAPGAALHPSPSPGGPYVAALSVVEMFVDDAYQRPLDQPRVRRMVTAWDPRMVGILDVSDRGPAVTPRYAIVNGQHRWAAAGMVGLKYMACNVHEGLDVAAEARLMYELDRTTKKLSGWDQWRARRTAGDPVVSTVERIAAAHGLTVDDTGTMRSYGTAEKLLKLGGEQLLNSALAILSAAYGTTSPTPYQAPLLMGLGQFLHRHGSAVDVNRLTRALAGTRPEQLRSTATALREVDGGQLHVLMTAAIAGAYNRTQGPGPRLSGSARA